MSTTTSTAPDGTVTEVTTTIASDGTITIVTVVTAPDGSITTTTQTIYVTYVAGGNGP